MKVLALGYAPLPFENGRMNYASSLRTWHFCSQMVKAGHDVMLLGCRIPAAYENESSLSPELTFKRGRLTYRSLAPVLFEDTHYVQNVHDGFKPDCLVGITAYPSSRAALVKSDKPMWADLFGHVMAEAQAKAAVYSDDIYLGYFWDQELKVLIRADVFSAVSNPQRYALVGELGAIHRLSSRTSGYEFVHVIPIGVEPTKPVHDLDVIRGRLAGKGDFVVLWSGGYNTWADVETLFRGLEKAMSKNPRIKFVSTGGAIFGHDEKTYPAFMKMVEKSRYKKNFAFAGWVKTREVHNYFLESDVGINVDKPCYETVLGARNRISEMLRAGLPVITTRGTEIASEVEANGLGFAFNPSDSDALCDALLKLASDKKLRMGMAGKAERYALSHLSYGVITKPLLEWAANPRRAPDHQELAGRPGKADQPLRKRDVVKKYFNLLREEGLINTNLKAVRFLKKKVLKH